MRKKSVFKSMLAVLMVALLSVGLYSCSGDSEVTPPQEVTIVGTWMYYFDDGDDGYCQLIFSGNKTNGSFTYIEVEGSHYDTETGSYTYSNGYLTLSVDDETEKIKVVSLTSDELILKDFPDHGNFTFVKRGSTQSVSIVGKWKYSFNSGYVLLTFSGSSTSGTVRYQEYDHGKWEDDKTASYQYSGGTKGTLKIYVDGQLEEKISVVSLTALKLVLKDWPDSDDCTFVKQ